MSVSSPLFTPSVAAFAAATEDGPPEDDEPPLEPSELASSAPEQAAAPKAKATTNVANVPTVLAQARIAAERSRSYTNGGTAWIARVPRPSLGRCHARAASLEDPQVDRPLPA